VTVTARELPDELDAVSRALLRSAGREGSKVEFLREVSAAILRVTAADCLELWIENRHRPYHWRAMSRPRLTYRLASLSSGPEAERWRRSHSGSSRPVTFLEHILPLVDDGGRLRKSGAHTPGGSVWLDEQAMVPFEIDGQDEGVLRLRRTGSEGLSARDVASSETLAHVLGVTIASRRAHAALTERIKELTCMYGIAQIAARPNLTLDETLREIVELLPAAWQYPDIATARITLDEREFPSFGFQSGPRALSADITLKGIRRGRVEVVYGDRSDRDEVPLFDDAPFLDEERHLIEGVARELMAIIGRRHAEEEAQRLQRQIRHADRLATIGELAAGVAHELNEPLGNILGFAQLASKSPDAGGQTRRDLEKIVAASLYAREIIKKLMFFSRQTPARRQDVDVNKVVDDVVSLLRPRCEKGDITVAVEPATPPPLVRGDAAQLQQVLVNLVVNAVQAMPGGGTLHLQTTRDDKTVRMILDDTGVGIAPENLQRVFMPFFTTKDIGEGTGLGLAVVHGIITLHGGSVRVESEVGKGTRFEIELPSADTVGDGLEAR
jgi:signal transduction histidine kinase